MFDQLKLIVSYNSKHLCKQKSQQTFKKTLKKHKELEYIFSCPRIMSRLTESEWWQAMAEADADEAWQADVHTTSHSRHTHSVHPLCRRCHSAQAFLARWHEVYEADRQDQRVAQAQAYDIERWQQDSQRWWDAHAS